MGACEFTNRVQGAPTAKAAFEEATSHARHEFGHGGYTGTIAEKRGFFMERKGVVAEDEAQRIIAAALMDEDHACNDKWGPAACLQIGVADWVFFGWASS